MSLYMILSKLTGEGAQALFKKPERIKEVNRELEKMGVKVLQQYLVFGEWDFLNIVEANDEKALVAALINLNMRGIVKTTTYRIIPVNEVIDAVSETS
ncbi:MAG: GYD domain superfamily [Hyperthermus sp.]|nr:MAG: GYD domain superfamily [Hyperthermus sp.]